MSAYGEWCPKCGAEIISVTRSIPSMGSCKNGHKTDRRDALRREPEPTVTDLSQATIAAALEDAAGVAVKAAATARYNLGKAMTLQDGQRWCEMAQWADQIRDAIRALITPDQRTALQAAIDAAKAKCRTDLTPPAADYVAEITMPQAVKFMEDWCLQYMDEMTPAGYDLWGFSLNCFATDNFTRDMARAILRRLTDKGLATFMRGLFTEDGIPAGSGYGITDKGRLSLAARPASPDTRVYLDLDGVMADFDAHYPAEFGQDHKSMADDDMWAKINAHPSYFEDMPLCPGAADFFAEIRHLKPIILTACPRTNYAHVAGQKRRWVYKHLGAELTVLPVMGGHNKHLFMHAPGDILIDDYAKNCAPWEASGGVAILHKSFAETRNRLRAIIEGGQDRG